MIYFLWSFSLAKFSLYGFSLDDEEDESGCHPFPSQRGPFVAIHFIFSGGGGSVTNGQDGAGPQVPPRLGGDKPGQDRVLSVSGKKKCSHCKEELGEL